MARMQQRLLVIGVILAVALVDIVTIAMAKEKEYPARQIDLLIMMNPGGSTDLATRGLIAAGNKFLSQPMIPINRPGGSGTIAVSEVLGAKPDGYTIGVCSSSQAIGASLSGFAPYKDISGFTWISKFGEYISPIVVRGDSPWKNFKELIAWAKKNPRGIKVGATGARDVDIKASMLHKIEKKEQVEFAYVSFKGGTEALTSLLGNHINLTIATIDATSASYIAEGKLRVLAYLGPDKIPGTENIPSLEESHGIGLPGFIVIYGPRGLPESVVKKLEDTFSKAVKEPEFVNIMRRMHMPVSYLNSVECTKHVEQKYAQVRDIFAEMRAADKNPKK
jgi:tripartite-type tricarboxylate transporter receptor subunit TctC